MELSSCGALVHWFLLRRHFLSSIGLASESMNASHLQILKEMWVQMHPQSLLISLWMDAFEHWLTFKDLFGKVEFLLPIGMSGRKDPYMSVLKILWHSEVESIENRLLSARTKDFPSLTRVPNRHLFFFPSLSLCRLDELEFTRGHL